MVIVRSKQERKVAEGLLAKGYEVFLPMHTVRRQWSDRLKTYDAPLFPGHLFCRFSLNAANKDLMVLKTPGVILIHPGGGKPLPIPDEEIAHLRRISASQYPVEYCALPQTGELVEIPGDIPIRGVLVERGSTCRVAIGFDTMGHTVALRVPLDDLQYAEGPLLPHWSLRSL
jgi:transcription antitermination factor NusG